MRLGELGITPGFSWIVDTSTVASGGIDDRTTTRNLWAANVELDLQKLVGLDGGRVFVEYQSHAGRDTTADVGAFQEITNIDAERSIHAFARVWFEQRLFDDALRVKVGKIDANNDFATVHYGGEFLLSSASLSPTILGLPTYPETAFGFDVFVEPCDALYLGIGLYDGSALEGNNTGSTGPSSFFHDSNERFLIGEAGLKWGHGAGSFAGRFAVGAWHQGGDFDRFDGGIEDGTDGLYAVLDQRLWARNPGDVDDERGVGCFLQFGTADDEVSDIDLHLGSGVAWRGPVDSRPDDVVGFGASRVQFSDRSPAYDESTETIFELFYHYQVTPWFTLKPDVEYVIDPGGDSSIDDALVLTLRARIDF
jgi:porin